MAMHLSFSLITKPNFRIPDKSYVLIRDGALAEYKQTSYLEQTGFYFWLQSSRVQDDLLRRCCPYLRASQLEGLIVHS